MPLQETKYAEKHDAKLETSTSKLKPIGTLCLHRGLDVKPEIVWLLQASWLLIQHFLNKCLVS
jgi:hypothetical protein